MIPLQIVVFIGTCATDSFAAHYICKSNTLECLIDLLKAKQEDDEIVLQVSERCEFLCLLDYHELFCSSNDNTPKYQRCHWFSAKHTSMLVEIYLYKICVSTYFSFKGVVVLVVLD